MLRKFILRGAVLAAALTCTTGSASAEQFRILMMENSFFPETSYLQPGDEVTFVNQSGGTLDVSAEDGSWTIEAMAYGGEATLMIVEGMTNAYSALAPGGDVANKVSGIMNFSVQQAQN